jgi:hypothetical protein
VSWKVFAGTFWRCHGIFFELQLEAYPKVPAVSADGIFKDAFQCFYDTFNDAFNYNWRLLSIMPLFSFGGTK